MTLDELIIKLQEIKTQHGGHLLVGKMYDLKQKKENEKQLLNVEPITNIKVGLLRVITQAPHSFLEKAHNGGPVTIQQEVTEQSIEHFTYNTNYLVALQLILIAMNPTELIDIDISYYIELNISELVEIRPDLPASLYEEWRYERAKEVRSEVIKYLSNKYKMNIS